MLARAQHPDEFSKLRKAFAKRVASLMSGYPSLRIISGEPIVCLDVTSGLLLPDEASALGDRVPSPRARGDSGPVSEFAAGNRPPSRQSFRNLNVMARKVSCGNKTKRGKAAR